MLSYRSIYLIVGQKSAKIGANLSQNGPQKTVNCNFPRPQPGGGGGRVAPPPPPPPLERARNGGERPEIRLGDLGPVP